jgi:hypothetical protein
MDPASDFLEGFRGYIGGVVIFRDEEGEKGG